MTRDERIALARATIESCLGPADQLDDDHQRDFHDPQLAVFRALTPSRHLGRVLISDVIERIAHAGFPSLEITAPALTLQGDGYSCYFRVPVGAP